jgi:hypothetical protein
MTVTTMTPGEIVEKYDVLAVGEDGEHPFIVVTEKGADRQFLETDPSLLREIGTSAPSPFTSFIRREYNPKLLGLEGLKVYDQMRKSDGTVRGALRLVKTPVFAARWFVDPKREDDGSVKKVNQTAADFVTCALNEYMSISWPQFLTEAMLMCEFGYYMFEKVWENRVVDGQMRTVLKKLAPRHPMDVAEWEYDRNGGPNGAKFYSPTGLPQDEYRIPIEKLLVFTFDREAGNIEGFSLLRSVYKHWYYKDTFYKIDAIQKERHGIGVPVIKLPPGFSDADKTAAQELGRNLRTNDRAHAVLPPNWDLQFVDLQGNPVDALKSVDHHNREIEKSILAVFLEGGAKDEDQVMFLKATRFIADIVCDTINFYLIPDLVAKNFMRADAPKLKARRIGETQDWRTLSFSMRNFVGSAMLTPDDPLEDFIRDELDLPRRDPESARTIETPQATPAAGNQSSAPAGGAANAPGKPAPPKVGTPRQQPTQKAKPPRGNAGTDRSGG